MIEITDKDRFAQVIADSIARVELTAPNSQTKKRWINAIAKATVEIEQNGVFMTWQEENHSLLIWSQKSNQIYTANGVCQCRAFDEGQACFHRAAARLVRLYMELETEVMKPAAKRAELTYLKPTTTFKAERVGGIRVN